MSDTPKPERTLADVAKYLDDAQKEMEDRAKTYDKPEGEFSMPAIVKGFNAITGLELTEEQGWLFMMVLKAVRSQQGEYRKDNYVDGVAYSAFWAQAAEETFNE